MMVVGLFSHDFNFLKTGSSAYPEILPPKKGFIWVGGLDFAQTLGVFVAMRQPCLLAWYLQLWLLLPSKTWPCRWVFCKWLDVEQKTMAIEAINVYSLLVSWNLAIWVFLPGCFRDCENMQETRTVDFFRTAESNEANTRQVRQIFAAK